MSTDWHRDHAALIKTLVLSAMDRVRETSVPELVECLSDICIGSPDILHVAGSAFVDGVRNRPENCDELAEVVVALQARWHESGTSKNIEGVRGSEVNKSFLFVCSITDACQRAFDNFPRGFKNSWMPPSVRKKRDDKKKPFSAVVQFQRHLYNHNLTGHREVCPMLVDLLGLTPDNVPEGPPSMDRGSFLHALSNFSGRDLVVTRARAPHDDMVQLACKLLRIVGPKLCNPDLTPEARALSLAVVSMVIHKLESLLDQCEESKGPMLYPDQLLEEMREIRTLMQARWFRHVVQLEECVDDEGQPLIIGRRLSGEQCALIHGRLCQLETEALRDQVARQLNVHACMVAVTEA